MQDDDNCYSEARCFVVMCGIYIGCVSHMSPVRVGVSEIYK